MDENYAKYLLEKTREDYNLISEDFSRTRNRIWEELVFLGKYANENEKVLDVGCGNGRLYEIFQEKTIDYYGIDFSEKLLEIAQKRYPQFKFQVADALNLPFPADFFDKAYSIAVLHHIPSKQFRIRFLREIRRVVSPEGLLVLTVWNSGPFKKAMIFLKHLSLKIIGKSKLDLGDALIPWGKQFKRYIHYFSKAELKELLQEAGFSIRKIEVVKRKKSGESNIVAVVDINPSSY